MTFEEDKVARAYVHEALKNSLPNLIKPLLLICFPVSLIASSVLYAYDTERPHAWILALVVTPAMLFAFRALPFIFLIFGNRWRIDDGHIFLNGLSIGCIEDKDLTGWSIWPEKELPGYYNLSITTKKARAAILLNEQTCPLELVRPLMQKRFGDPVVANRGQAL